MNTLVAVRHKRNDTDRGDVTESAPLSNRGRADALRWGLRGSCGGGCPRVLARDDLQEHIRGHNRHRDEIIKRGRVAVRVRCVVRAGPHPSVVLHKRPRVDACR